MMSKRKVKMNNIEPKIINVSEKTYPLLLMEKDSWLDKPEYRKESNELFRVLNDLTIEKIHLNKSSEEIE